jgi:hypothetical protein
MLFFELFPLFVAVVSLIVAVVLLRLNAKLARRNELFVAATSSYLLFEDPWAMQAAILAALTTDQDVRHDAVAALKSIARVPDPLLPSLLAADGNRVSPLHDRAALEAAVLVGRRAVHLATLIDRFDGNLHELRQDLARQAPRYERALRDGRRLDIGPFAGLDRAVVHRLNRVLMRNASLN